MGEIGQQFHAARAGRARCDASVRHQYAGQSEAANDQRRQGEHIPPAKPDLLLMVHWGQTAADKTVFPWLGPENDFLHRIF